MGNDNKKTSYLMIDMDLLHSGLAYQRPIDMDFVLDKVKHFDSKEVDQPKVSFRDGEYRVVDGQHTIEICKMKGWTKIRCEVRRGLSVKEENDWFVTTNSKHRPQSKNRLLNGRYFGSDEDVKEMTGCLSSVGYKLNTSDITNKTGLINASDTVEKIYKELGKENFVKFITLHAGIWEKNEDSLKASFLKGFKRFYDTYFDSLSEKRCVTVFTKYINDASGKYPSPTRIALEAKSDVYTKDVSLQYARVFVKYYNLGLQKAKQLKTSRLDD